MSRTTSAAGAAASRALLCVLLSVLPLVANADDGGGGRQGGDTLADATVVTTIPYFATGTTSGFHDDLDAACPATSTSPDVVYRYTSPIDQQVSIDLCGSGFNTKAYVLDADGDLVACDDNHYTSWPCGPLRSLIEGIWLQADATYFVVIDGANGAQGSYQLGIVPYEVHVFTPPWYARPEGEPPLVEGYADNFNGGCDAPGGGTPVNLHPYDPAMGYAASVHGRSGWYRNASGTMVRDTDWFSIQIYAQGELDLTFEATEPCYVHWIADGWTCANIVIADYTYAAPGQVARMTISGPYASEITVRVRPAQTTPPSGEAHEFEYLLNIDAWEAPYNMPLSDYSFGSSVISHPRNKFYQQMDALADDYSPAGVCNESADVSRDGIFQVHLWHGQQLNVSWPDVWYPAAEAGASRADTVCFYLTTDARMTPGSCVGANCGRNTEYGFTTTFVAQETGWHYLVCDYDATPSAWLMMANISFPAATPYLPPPPAPPHDTCDGALTLPSGAFTIDDDLSAATNTADPGRDGCLDRPDLKNTGRDVVYRVDLVAGDVLNVTMTGQGDWEEALYLVGDCESPMGTCVASGEPAGDGVHLVYPSFQAQTLWLICDSWGVGARAFTLAGSLTSVTEVAVDAPLARGIRSIQPNPCNPRTTIALVVDRAGPVTLGVFDLRGHLVKTLLAEPRDAGEHTVTWDGTDAAGRAVASGAYVVRYDADGHREARKVVVLK